MARGARRARQPLLLQTTLDQYRFSSGRRSPGSILDRLPTEIFMHIITFLPRLHADVIKHAHPFELPLRKSNRTDIDETAANINSCAAERLFPDGCRKYCEESRPWNWLVILRVCKTWHNIAYSCPAFWQIVPLQSTYGTRRSVQISTSLPLFIRPCNWTDSHTNSKIRRNLQIALSAMRHIATLDLISWDPEDDTVLQLLAEQNAKELRSLTIVCIGSFFSPRLAKLPDGLFLDEPPALLKSLRLQSCIITSPQPLYSPSLTTLDLERCSGAFQNKEQLLSVFHSLTALRNLRIIGASALPLPFAEVYIMSPRDPPFLSQLESIDLSAEVVPMANFLDHIHFPSTSSLELTIRYDRGTSWSLAKEHLGGFLTRHFAPALGAKTAFTNIEVALADDRSGHSQYEYENIFSSPTGSTHAQIAQTLPDRAVFHHCWSNRAIALDIEDITSDLVARIPLPNLSDPKAPSATFRLTEKSQPSPAPQFGEWVRPFWATKLRELRFCEEDAIRHGLHWLTNAAFWPRYPDLEAISFVYGEFPPSLFGKHVLEDFDWLVQSRAKEGKYKICLIECEFAESWVNTLNHTLGEDVIEVVDSAAECEWMPVPEEYIEEELSDDEL